MSKTIIDVINLLCDKMGIAIDWTSENIIPQIQTLCEKFISYEIYSSIMAIVVAWSACILIFIPTIINHPKARKLEWDMDYSFICVAVVIGWVLFALAILVAFILTTIQLNDIIACKYFPEKVIYDYVVNLIETR